MRMNSNFTSGSEISSGSGTTARKASISVRYVIIRNSRFLKWYGPRGNAGLVSGIENAVALISDMFIIILYMLMILTSGAAKQRHNWLRLSHLH